VLYSSLFRKKTTITENVIEEMMEVLLLNKCSRKSMLITDLTNKLSA